MIMHMMGCLWFIGRLCVCEREREREREVKERGGERERERGKKRERGREKERERVVGLCVHKTEKNQKNPLILIFCWKGRRDCEFFYRC